MRHVPSNEGDWIQEYARTASAEWHGNEVFIRNIRNFIYQTREVYQPEYFDASYDVDGLRTVDLVVSRWAGESIAHVFLSFGFCDGRFLSISIETRRKKGQRYSTFGGFFKNYNLIYVVADERDLIGVRTDIRKERVCLFRANVSEQTVQTLFRDYLQRVNALNAHPEFYHTLFNNCTTNILRHARAVSPVIRYNWRVLLSGHADRYSYDLKLLDTSVSFEELKAQSLIWRADDAVIDAGYSAAIRSKKPD